MVICIRIIISNTCILADGAIPEVIHAFVSWTCELNSKTDFSLDMRSKPQRSSPWEQSVGQETACVTKHGTSCYSQWNKIHQILTGKTHAEKLHAQSRKIVWRWSYKRYMLITVQLLTSTIFVCTVFIMWCKHCAVVSVLPAPSECIVTGTTLPSPDNWCCQNLWRFDCCWHDVVVGPLGAISNTGLPGSFFCISHTTSSKY